jgi:serine/threonine protein kinase
MHTTVVQNPQRPTNRLALRYLSDLAKGLIAVHNCNIIHARVKPSALYLDAHNTAMLGEFGKVELDSARQTHQLFSKLLIGEAIPKTLVYWAPELLRLEKVRNQSFIVGFVGIEVDWLISVLFRHFIRI